MGKLKFIANSAYLQNKDPELAKQLKCLEYVEETIKDLILRCLEEGAGLDIQRENAGSSKLEERDFYRLQIQTLSAGELDKMNHRLIKLAHRLASSKSRRKKNAAHGRVDLRRTINKALATGEAPFILKYRRNKPGKPSIVLLCDVSKSVLSFSEFMLLFVYALQNRFHHVRSFLFVDLIDEVTDLLKDDDLSESIREAISRGMTCSRGITDLGRVLAMFVREYLPFVSRKSTVIILSDARNNGLPPEKKYLEIIRNKVKRVIWLNPQPQEEWDKGDNIMGVYAPFCHQVFECRNLKQLEAFADALGSGLN